MVGMSISKPLENLNMPNFGMSVTGGPVWRFKGSSSLTPHVGVYGGFAYAQVGRYKLVAPGFGVTLPLLIRASPGASVAIEPSIGGTIYKGEFSLGVSMSFGIAVDLGS